MRRTCGYLYVFLLFVTGVQTVIINVKLVINAETNNKRHLHKYDLLIIVKSIRLKSFQNSSLNVIAIEINNSSELNCSLKFITEKIASLVNVQNTNLVRRTLYRPMLQIQIRELCSY